MSDDRKPSARVPSRSAGLPSSQSSSTSLGQPNSLDLRLLVPAVVAWSFTAAVLAWPVAALLVVAAGAVACAAVVMTLGGRGRGRSPGRNVVGLCLAAVALVGVSTAGHTAARTAGPLTSLAKAHAVVTVEGVVATEPTVRTLPGRDALMVRFRLTATEVSARGTRSTVRTPVLVMADERWQHVQWREGLRVKGRVVPAEGGDDVVALIRPMGGPVSTHRPGPVERGAEHLRAGLREAAEPLPRDARGLLPALVIGDTSRTPQDLTDAMLATGMTHLSAVSGVTAQLGVFC